MKKHLIIICLFFGATVFAQQKGIRNLTVGDRVPDIAMPHIINYKTHSGKLSDFAYKDKLVIIDFWATSCSGCVAGLPKMYALQEKFGDSLRIIPVTYEPGLSTAAFWKRNKYIKNLNMLSVVDDKLFGAYFKHLYIPHEVWIYKGVVMAITFSDYVTADNIRQVLSGKKVSWEIKNDFLTDIDYTKPILRVDPKQYTDPEGPLSYAAVFGYRELALGGKMGIARDSVRHTIRSYFVNHTVLGAYFNYWHQLRDPDFKKPELLYYADYSRCIFEVKDPMVYASSEQTGEYQNLWHRKHLICYEAVYPDTGQTKEQLSRADLANLDHLLGLHGRYEMRKMKCLVLVKGSGPTSSAITDELKKSVSKTGSVIKNMSIAEVVNHMNMFVGNPPVFNETGEDIKINLELNTASWADLAGIRSALKRQGIDVKEEERELEVFVLTATR